MRHKKIGLDYFPLDTVFDEKIEALDAMYGNDGIAFFIRILQKAYRDEFGEANVIGIHADIIAKVLHISVERLHEIIEFCIKINLFYRTEKDFLTSNGIQKRISLVSKDRADALKRYHLLKEKKVKKSKVKDFCNTSAKYPRSIIYSPEFENFWSVYPRKKAKAAAFQSWQREIKNTLPEIIISGAKKYRDETSSTEEKYIKHPATWLNGQCWLDERNNQTIKTEWQQPNHSIGA